MLGVIAASLGVVTGYVYVGYPMTVVALSRRKAVESLDSSTPPFVSVVVAAFNECDSIAGKVRNLLSLEYPADRIQFVIVTDGSDDGTEAVARRESGGRVRVLHRPGREGKARAMERGVEASKGDVIVFMDANNLCPPDAISELVRPFADPQVGAVTGAKVVDGGVEALTVGEKLYWRYESAIKQAESQLGCCTGVIGELLAVRRELVPVFPPGLVQDDFFIAMQVARAGFNVAYAPRALSLEPTASSAEADAVRRRRIAAGRWQALAWWKETLPLDRPVVLWEVTSHKYLRLLLPFTMAGSFIANAADVAVGVGKRDQRLARAALVGQLAFYGLACLGPRTPGPRQFRAAASAARYLTKSNLASAEGLQHYLTGRKTLHLWQKVERLPAPAIPALSGSGGTQ